MFSRSLSAMHIPAEEKLDNYFDTNDWIQKSSEPEENNELAVLLLTLELLEEQK